VQYAHVHEPLALWDVWTRVAALPVVFEPPSAGFVLDWLGHLPQIAESLDTQGWRFEIVDLDGRRVDKILATRLAGGRRRAAA